jgi:acyl-CoA thioesterase-1
MLVPFMLNGIDSNPQLIQADQIHPTKEAQVLILNNIWPHLKNMLK